jgi:hypothetical protein
MNPAESQNVGCWIRLALPVEWLFVLWCRCKLYPCEKYDEPNGQNYIPLAPDFTHRWSEFSKWNGFSRYRYLKKSRPANEDNSIVAKGYAIDFNINYTYKTVTFGCLSVRIYWILVEWNLNCNWIKIAKWTASVEEIHFTRNPLYEKLHLHIGNCFNVV